VGTQVVAAVDAHQWLVPAVAALLVPLLWWLAGRLRAGLATVEELAALRTELAETRSRAALHRAEDQGARTRQDADLLVMRERLAALPTTVDLHALRLGLEQMRTDVVREVGGLRTELRGGDERNRAQDERLDRLMRHVELHGRILSECASDVP